MPARQLVAALVLLGACSAAPAAAPTKAARAGEHADAALVARGQERIAHFECARCHDGAGETTELRDCVGCHQRIQDGSFDADASTLARWNEHLRRSRSALVHSFDLRRAASFRRDWVAGMLMHPVDIRPHLGPMMPRLRMSEEDARAIAHALVPTEEFELSHGDAARGEVLVREGRCGRCHERDGEALPGHELRGGALEAAVVRAPDLAHVGRWQTTHLVRWLMDPRAIDANTLMPQTGFSEQDARDVAAFLLPPAMVATSTWAPAADEEMALPRLPVLERDVLHDEVEARVFRRLCWHCHGDPDFALSEGGPGNTGGFGFAPRRLDLSSYEGILSGAVDADGAHYSVVFGEGTPRLVEVLLARHRETMPLGETGEMRGMPLGMPPLSFEDIQLVESWIAQGARR